MQESSIRRTRHEVAKDAEEGSGKTPSGGTQEPDLLGNGAFGEVHNAGIEVESSWCVRLHLYTGLEFKKQGCCNTPAIQLPVK